MKKFFIEVSFKLDGRWRKGDLEFSVEPTLSDKNLFWVPWSEDPQPEPKSGDKVPHIKFGRIWYKTDGGCKTLSTYDHPTDFKWGTIL